MKNFFALILAAGILLLAAGCAVLSDNDWAADPTSDVGITALANSRLNNDFVVGRATLSARVENGMATLYGTVPDEATRQRALQILQGTPGVFDVLDHTRRR